MTTIAKIMNKKYCAAYLGNMTCKHEGAKCDGNKAKCQYKKEAKYDK